MMLCSCCSSCILPTDMLCAVSLSQLDALIQDAVPEEHKQRMEDLQASSWLPTAWECNGGALPFSGDNRSRQQLELTFARGPRHQSVAALWVPSAAAAPEAGKRKHLM